MERMRNICVMSRRIFLQIFSLSTFCWRSAVQLTVLFHSSLLNCVSAWTFFVLYYRYCSLNSSSIVQHLYRRARPAPDQFLCRCVSWSTEWMYCKPTGDTFPIQKKRATSINKNQFGLATGSENNKLKRRPHPSYTFFPLFRAPLLLN